MKAWFVSLTQRERMMVKYAGFVLLIFIIYVLIIDPIMSNYERNKKNVATAEATLSWMRSAAIEVKQLRGNNAVPDRPQGKRFILTMVDRSARKAGLGATMKRVQPEGESGVRIWFEKTPFDEFIKWLSKMESKSGLSVSEINIEQTESVGLVNIRVFLDS